MGVVRQDAAYRASARRAKLRGLDSCDGGAGETADEAAHFEDAEGGEDAVDGEAGISDELVDGGGVGADGVEDLLFEVVELKFGGMADLGSVFLRGGMG